MKINNSLFCVTTVIAVAGCTSARFIDDFEVDTIGEAPLAEPDGTPSDRVLSVGRIGSITVSNVAPIAGSKSLNIAGPGRSVVYMYAEALNDTSQGVYASWEGRLSPGSAANISLFSGHFSTIAEIIFDTGVITAGGNQVGAYSPGQDHSILLYANPANDTYQVSSFGAVSSGGLRSGSVTNPSEFPQTIIGLSFALIDGGSTDNYRVDSVRMTEGRPPS
ncbi:hypothetical protein [Roseovarius sp. Pro17]|uniref:hypothetical protein n=1 Tax=Roseovarius sp. Pro17 TaxID=3108175 RepID=UPI002D795354|nr:hypothetical protein [Roseovarius sp. Pro17]